MKMKFVQRFMFTFLLVLLIGLQTTAMENGRSAPANHWRTHRPPYQTIIVDKYGQGNFTTIQAAIDAIPSNNMEWICIYITAGTYKEQIKIRYDQPMIYLKGAGKRKTYVVWGAHDSIETGATFISEADNIVAKSITFVNSYNYPMENNGNAIKTAVAAKILGDKSAFYRCGFLGFQDTLWDVSGRHYFKLCSIQGAVDFIMGSGQSIYERCTVSVIAAFISPQPGFITAQSRNDPSENNGLVFKDCNVIGNGTTYLGRPWRGHARVLFYNSTLSNVVVPEGWIQSLTPFANVDNLVFAEEDCRGAGSDKSKRVKWENKMSREEVKRLTSMSYIDEEGWLQQQAFHMLP